MHTVTIKHKKNGNVIYREVYSDMRLAIVDFQKQRKSMFGSGFDVDLNSKEN